MAKTYNKHPDELIERLLERYGKRADEGMERFGHPVLKSNRSNIQWITDAQEELWDAIVYLEALKVKFKNKADI